MPWDQFLFSLDGRITRTSWWLRFVVPAWLILQDFAVIAGPIPDLDELRVVVPVWLIVLDYTVIAGPMPDLIVAAGALTLTGFLLWLAIAVSVKRYHDHDRSGWFLLIALIPQLGTFWVLIELGLLRGTRGPNRFGPDPRRPTSISRVEPSLTAPGTPMFREVLAEDGRENR
jgi:uncharacterized membrane protein YhaH (DUF805 family)